MYVRLFIIGRVLFSMENKISDIIYGVTLIFTFSGKHRKPPGWFRESPGGGNGANLRFYLMFYF